MEDGRGGTNPPGTVRTRRVWAIERDPSSGAKVLTAVVVEEPVGMQEELGDDGGWRMIHAAALSCMAALKDHRNETLIEDLLAAVQSPAQRAALVRWMQRFFPVTVATAKGGRMAFDVALGKVWDFEGAKRMPWHKFLKWGHAGPEVRVMIRDGAKFPLRG